MNKKITQHNLFRPTKSKSETKAEITDHTAKGIIAAETKARDAKSARLRAARLENEEGAPAPATKSPKQRKAAPKPRT